MIENMVWVLGWRPNHSEPLHTMGQKKCFWIPRTGVFETHHANKCGVGSGVAPQTGIPVDTMGQKKCFWIPRMVVFVTHRAKKYGVGSCMFLPTPCTSSEGYLSTIT